MLWLLGFRTGDLVWHWDGKSVHPEMSGPAEGCVDQDIDMMAWATVDAVGYGE